MLKAFGLFLITTALTSAEVHWDHATCNNEFGVDVLNELVKENRSNIVFSSFSLENILQLTYLGSRGETAEQLKKALQFPDDEKLQNHIKSVHAEINAVNGSTLILANKLFFAKNLLVDPEFTKLANELFNADVENIDFDKNTKAAEEINSWIANKTHDRIQNLVREEELSVLTRLVLANSLYFKGEFEHPFNPEDTKKMDFHKDNNETVKVDMMELTHVLPVHVSEEHDMTLVQLPYSSSHGKVRLVVMLPHEETNRFLSMGKKLGPKQRGNYTKQNVRIFLPKFRIESTIDFKPILRNLGITKIFSAPDFSGITSEAVEVSAINQKVFIDVNEHGTESAAATTELGNARSLAFPKTPKAIHFNRPFYFGVMLDEILLLGGRVMNPLEK